MAFKEGQETFAVSFSGEPCGSCPGRKAALNARLRYCEKVPVLLRSDTDEEKEAALVFSISTDAANLSGQRLKILRVQLTCEEEPFFLHLLDMTEEDYETLKADQGIVVDFERFPGKIVSLLEKCSHAAGANRPPKYQAMLTVRGAKSVLRVVETNDFKQLAHISLIFHMGRDAVVKEKASNLLLLQHLAGQLRDTNTQLANALVALTDCKAEKGALQAKLAEAEQRIAKHELESVGREDAIRLEAARQAADASHKHSRELLAAADEAKREQELLQAACAKHEAEGRALKESNASLLARLSEATQAQASEAAARSRAEADLRAAEAQKARTAAEATERAEVITDLRSSRRALEEQLTTQVGLCAEKSRQVDLLQGSLDSAEAKNDQLKEWGSAHERRASEAAVEIERLRQIIARLTEDLRTAREKLQRKQTIIERQKGDLQSRQQALETTAAGSHQASDAVKKLQIEAQTLQVEAKTLQGENKELREQLESCSKQLQENEQMIRWLNNQVNEAHMGYGKRNHFQASLRRNQGVTEPEKSQKVQQPGTQRQFKSMTMQQLEATARQKMVH